MICPQCKREYRRQDFSREETYFECDDCSVALEGATAPSLIPSVVASGTACGPPEIGSLPIGTVTRKGPVLRGFLWATGAFAICMIGATVITGPDLMSRGGFAYTAPFFLVLVWIPIFVAVTVWGYLWRFLTRTPSEVNDAGDRKHGAPYVS